MVIGFPLGGYTWVVQMGLTRSLDFNNLSISGSSKSIARSTPEVMMSPHGLCRGKTAESTIIWGILFWLKVRLAEAPAGPAPIIQTSVRMKESVIKV